MVIPPQLQINNTVVNLSRFWHTPTASPLYAAPTYTRSIISRADHLVVANSLAIAQSQQYPMSYSIDKMSLSIAQLWFKKANVSRETNNFLSLLIMPAHCRSLSSVKFSQKNNLLEIADLSAYADVLIANF